jgi:hypothetical protein
MAHYTATGSGVCGTAFAPGQTAFAPTIDPVGVQARARPGRHGAGAAHPQCLSQPSVSLSLFLFVFLFSFFLSVFLFLHFSKHEIFLDLSILESESFRFFSFILKLEIFKKSKYFEHF